MSRDAWIAMGVGGALCLAVAIFLTVRVLMKRKWLAELGTGGQVAFWVALVYAVFPLDILPDPIYFDDLAVVGGAALYIIRLLLKKRKAGPRPTKSKLP